MAVTKAQQAALALLADRPDDARVSNRNAGGAGPVRIHMRTAEVLQRQGLVTIVQRRDDRGHLYLDVGLTEEGRREVNR